MPACAEAQHTTANWYLVPLKRGRGLIVLRALLLLLFALIFSSGAVVLAAPACSQVLLNSQLKQSDATALINDLAQLKMELDLTQASGQQSIATKALADSFNKKLSELYKKLENQQFHVQIKNLIVDRIQELQSLQNSEQKNNSEARVKGEAKTDKLISPFKMTKQIAIDDYSIGLFEYLPDLKSVIFQSYKSKELVLFNIENGARAVVQEKSKIAIVVPELNQVLSMTDSGELLRFDTVNGKVISRVKTGLSDLIGKIAIDEKHNRIIVQTGHNSYLVDISKVNQQGMHDSSVLGNFKGGTLVDMVFASEKEILFASMNRLQIMDLDTQQTREINTGRDIYSIKLSADRKYLLWTEGTVNTKNGVVPVHSIHKFMAVSRMTPQGAGQVKFGKKPDEIYMDFKTYRALFKIDDLETPIQIFERDPYFVKNAFSLSPMFATEKLFFTREQINDPLNKTGAVILEVWQKD